jgi:hypothetical protein
MSVPVALLVVVAFLPPETLICPEEAVKKRTRAGALCAKDMPIGYAVCQMRWPYW